MRLPTTPKDSQIWHNDNRWIQWAALDHERYRREYAKCGLIIESGKKEAKKVDTSTVNRTQVKKMPAVYTPFIIPAKHINETCRWYFEPATDFETRRMRYCKNPAVVAKIGALGMLKGCQDGVKSRGECAVIDGQTERSKNIKMYKRRSGDGLTPEQKIEIARQYFNGRDTVHIAKEFDRSCDAIRTAIKNVVKLINVSWYSINLKMLYNYKRSILLDEINRMRGK